MPKSILVLDDPTRSLAPLTAGLEEHGYNVEVLFPDDDPVQQFGLQLPDLVVLHLKADGAVDICDGVRSNPDGAIVPIIYVGDGTGGMTSPSDALAKGGDYYFDIGAPVDRILSKVQTYIGPGEDRPDIKPVEAPTAAPAPAQEPAKPESEPTVPKAMKEEDTLHESSKASEASVSLPTFEWGAEPIEAGAGAGAGEATDSLTSASEELMARIDKHEAEMEAKGRSEQDIRDSQGATPSPDQRSETDARDDASAPEDIERQTEEEVSRLAEEEIREQHRKAEEAERKAAEEIERKVAEEIERKVAEEAERKAAEEIERKVAEEAERKAAEEIERKAAERKEAKEAEEAEREAAEEIERKAVEEIERKAVEEIERKAVEEIERKAAEEAALRRAKDKAEQEAEQEQARKRAEEEAHRKAEEGRQHAKEETRKKAEDDIRRQVEAEVRKRVEEEARVRVEEETRKRAEEEARKRVEEEARRRAEEDVRLRAEEEARRRIEEEAKKRVEEEARIRAEEEARRRIEEEARRRAEEEARLRAQEEARLRAEEETRNREQEEERRRAAAAVSPEEERQRVEEEIRRKVEAEVRRSMGLPKEPEPAPAAPEAAPVRAAQAPSVGLSPLHPLEGVLSAGHDIASVIHSAWGQKVTGRVDFSHDGRTASVFFEAGAPVDARSSSTYDRMEEYLLREGKITRAGYQEVRVKGLKGPRPVGAHLVSEGFLKPRELFNAVRGHLEDVVCGLFEWEEGTYRYSAEPVSGSSRVSLDRDPRSLIIEGIRRKYLMPRLVKRVGAPSSLLGPAEDTSMDLEPLELGPEERKVARLLDGTRSVEDLVFSTGLEAARVYHMLAAFLALGYAQVLVRGVEGVEQDGSSANDSIDRARIREKLEQARRADYFQVLGVPRNATAYEVERAYERITQEFHPKHFPEGVRQELHGELLEIGQVLQDALQVLRDDNSRTAYARHLP